MSENLEYLNIEFFILHLLFIRRLLKKGDIKMTHKFSRILMIIGLSFFMVLGGPTEVTYLMASEKAGVLHGRLVWADNSPVLSAKVKLFDKLDVFTRKVFNMDVQQIAISRDANVMEMDVDNQGRFKFTELPSGKYYLYYQVPQSTQGDEWVYQYHMPALIAYYVGHMHKPVEYEVKEGKSTKIRDIEFIKPISPALPSPILDKNGVYEFTWPEDRSKGAYHLTIEHLDYKGSLQNSVYGAHIIKESRYRIPAEKPLYPGSHRFKVEKHTPTLRVYAKSTWINFKVPGGKFFLKVNKNKTDSTDRTVTWAGSDLISSVKVVSEDGTISINTTDHNIVLPSTKSLRRFQFYALDKDGKEIIPGWKVFYSQPETKPTNSKKLK
jgi:hypothetical protein